MNSFALGKDGDDGDVNDDRRGDKERKADDSVGEKEVTKKPKSDDQNRIPRSVLNAQMVTASPPQLRIRSGIVGEKERFEAFMPGIESSTADIEMIGSPLPSFLIRVDGR